LASSCNQDDMRQEAEKLIFAYAATFNKQDVAGLGLNEPQLGSQKFR
jgi:hypothetical protein